MAMPRVFFHAHLACFDIGITTLIFATSYAFWRSMTSTFWAVATGFIFGIALSIKLNAFFLPVPLFIYYFASRWREFKIVRLPEGNKLRLPPIPLALLFMLIIGPLILIATWPWVWHDTFGRLSSYVGYHSKHEHYDVFYWGQILKQPPFPWLFPFVMSFFTIPEMLVVLGGIGFCLVFYWQFPWSWIGSLARVFRNVGQRLFRVLRRRPRATLAGEGAIMPTGPPSPAVPGQEGPPAPPKAAVPGENGPFIYRARGHFKGDRVELLILLNAFIPFAIIAVPSTPIFGGVKHWMTAMPYIAIIAAVAFHWVLARLSERIPLLRHRPRLFALALGLLCLLPAYIGLYRSHPYGTSYYNIFAGGLNGSGKLGMHRQFWGYAARGGLKWLNENAEQGARVCFHNTNIKAYRWYHRDGLVRKDLTNLSRLWHADCRYDQADYLLYHHQEAFKASQYRTWHEFGTLTPEHVLSRDGLPLLSIYKKAIRYLPSGMIVYGTRPVGRHEPMAGGIRITARQNCAALLDRSGVLTRADGQVLGRSKNMDGAFRTLHQSCFGSRLPR